MILGCLMKKRARNTLQNDLFVWIVYVSKIYYFFPFCNVFLVLYLQKNRFTIKDVLSPPSNKEFLCYYAVSHSALHRYAHFTNILLNIFRRWVSPPKQGLNQDLFTRLLQTCHFTLKERQQWIYKFSVDLLKSSQYKYQRQTFFWKKQIYELHFVEFELKWIKVWNFSSKYIHVNLLFIKSGFEINSWTKLLLSVTSSSISLEKD